MSDPEIVTEGSGWHEQLGDRAELDVGFAATERTRAAAVTALGAKLTPVADVLGRAGVTVVHRRLWVQNEWRRDRIVGCRAGEDIALRITDLGVLEGVLSSLVSAEPAGLSGPTWVLADPGAARREAQGRAVADARDRAEGYAAALGTVLGPLVRLSETPEHHPMTFRAAVAEGGPVDVRSLGLEPEPVRVTAGCTTVWRLLVR